MAQTKLTKEKLLEMLHTMVRIREFENEAIELAKQNLTRAAVHTYNGEEAIATGVCAHLTDQDYITSTHRGHGHCVAKGADLKKMFAELMARESGYCKGKGGSMHIADLAIGMLGANGIVGGGIPIATGAALGISTAIISRFASLETARPMKARSTNRSTLQAYGNCRWYLSVKTINMEFPRIFQSP